MSKISRERWAILVFYSYNMNCHRLCVPLKLTLILSLGVPVIPCWKLWNVFWTLPEQAAPRFQVQLRHVPMVKRKGYGRCCNNCNDHLAQFQAFHDLDLHPKLLACLVYDFCRETVITMELVLMQLQLLHSDGTKRSHAMMELKPKKPTVTRGIQDTQNLFKSLIKAGKKPWLFSPGKVN